MRPCAIVLLLMFVPVAMGAEVAWPGKGDTVYISASFKKIDGPSPVAGIKIQYDIPTCAEFTITKANAEKSVWVVRDAMNGKLRLERAWPPRLHKDKAACEEFMSSAGEPAVERIGNTFKIVPAGSK